MANLKKRGLYAGEAPAADYDNLPESHVVSVAPYPESLDSPPFETREQPSHADLIREVAGTHMHPVAGPGVSHAPDVEVVAVASYDDATVQQLRAEMKARGLSYKDMKKAEMVAALDADDEANEQAYA